MNGEERELMREDGYIWSKTPLIYILGGAMCDMYISLNSDVLFREILCVKRDWNASDGFEVLEALIDCNLGGIPPMGFLFRPTTD